MAYGTREQARDYCCKDGEWIECGVWVEEERGRRTDIEVMVDQATHGISFYDAACEVPSSAQFPYAYTKLLEGRARSLTAPYRPVKVIVKVGPTGCGKTKSSYDIWPDLFVQECSSGNEMWWDGYEGQTRLVLDEFTGASTMGWRYLLLLTDVYPMRLQVKGGFTYAKWSEVIITTNTAICDWYPKIPSLAPLLRRIDHVERYYAHDLFICEYPNAVAL